MRQIDRIAIENVQRTFTKQLVGYSSSLNYKQRCDLLHLEPLWLRRMKNNLSFFHSLLKYRSCKASPVVRDPLSLRFSLRQNSHSVTVPSSRTSLRSNFFIVKYSQMWNKLPPNVRAISHLPRFKEELNKRLDVLTLVSNNDPYTSEERAYEVGLGY